MRVVLDRNRGGSYLSALLMGAGMFGVFLFLTYYLQLTLGYSALETGVAFLPFAFGIVLGAGFSAQMLTRVGPRVLMFAGMLLAAAGMVLLTRIGLDTGFWTHVFPAELIISFGMGVTFGPMSNTALVGVAEHDAGVASALINTTQQIGGSLGTALLNTIFTSAVAGYIAGHAADRSQLPAVQGAAVVHGYTVAFWVSAAVIGAAALIALALVKASRQEVASTEAVPVAA
jgi:predicted MFS family arabinose efflux permease